MAWTAVPDGNLILPQNWVGNPGATGGLSINGETGQVSLTSAGARTIATQAVPTQVGQRYRYTYYIESSQSIASPVGTTDGGSDLIAEFLRSPAPGDIGLEFVATTATTYVGLSRSTTGNPRASSIVLEKLPSNVIAGRRLNGLTQSFGFNVAGAGLRTANYNWFIGGWFKFTYMPTAAVYLLDFGDTTTAAGAGRNRLVWDAPNSKLFCSSSISDGTSYRECALVTPLQRDTWYHVGMMCLPGGDIQLYLNGVAVGTRTGAQPTPFVENLCKFLTIGARTGTSVTNYAPASFTDWIWCSNTVPTGAQIAAMADRKRPNEISGFSPTYWWGFDQNSTTETSKTGTATLTANGAPTTVVGPMPAVAVVTPTLSRPLDFILI